MWEQQIPRACCRPARSSAGSSCMCEGKNDQEAFADWTRGSRLIALLHVPCRSEPAPPKVTASEIILAVDPTQSSVHWTVDSALHTAHGTFATKRGSLQFDPA